MHLEKCSLNSSSSSFEIRVNVLYPYPYLVPSLFIIISLVFSYLPMFFIFCGFVQFNCSFVRRKKTKGNIMMLTLAFIASSPETRPAVTLFKSWR